MRMILPSDQAATLLLSLSLCDITSWDQGIYNCLGSHKKSCWCLAENNSQKLFIYQLCRKNAMTPCSTTETAAASLSGFHREDPQIITAIA